MKRVAVLMLNGIAPSKEVTALPKRVLDRHAKQLQNNLKRLGQYSFDVFDPIIGKPVHEVKGRMARYLKKASDLVKSDGYVLFLFFYLGHADVLDNNLRFIGPGFDLQVPGSMYSVGDLCKDIGDFNLPKSIIVLDCCFAGFAGGNDLRAALDQQCVYLMASTTSSHAAQLRPDRPVGVFTDEILGALTATRHSQESRRGLGDPDNPGTMTFQSLFGYVKKRIEKSDSQQLPTEQGGLGREVVCDLTYKPEIQPELDLAAPRKSYYRKFYRLLTYLNQRAFGDLRSLHRHAESQEDPEFETPIQDSRTGDLSKQCIGIARFAEYAQILRRLGLVDPSSLSLTHAGKACAKSDGAQFNIKMHDAVIETLSGYGIDFKAIENVAWKHAHDFQFTTAAILFDSLSQQAVSPTERRLSFTRFRILLELLARTKALRTNDENVFLPM